MSRQWWGELLVSSQVDGPALNTSVTATSLLPTHAKYVLPAGFFDVPGKALRIKAAGRLSNVVTTPGTFTLDVRMGPASPPTIVVFNGGAMQMSTTAHVTLPVWFDIMLTCRTVGSGTTATLMGQGTAHGQPLSLTAVADSTTDVGTLMLPNVTPVVGTGFDSTVANIIDLFGTFSISNAGNGITIHQYWLEALN